MFQTIKFWLFAISVVVISIAVAAFVSYRLAQKFWLDDITVGLEGTARVHSEKLALWIQVQEDIVAALAPAAAVENPRPALQQALESGKLDLVYVGHADKRMISVPDRQHPP